MGDLDAAFWVDVIWKGATVLAVAFYWPVVRGLDRLDRRIAKAEDDMGGLRNRQSEIEGQFHSAPKEKHISDLHERINQTTINLTNQIGDVSRELGEVIGKLDSSNDLLKSIHTAIINGNRK